MAEIIVIDPLREASTNVPLVLNAPGWRVIQGVALSADGGHDYPLPEPEDVWVSSPETEGDLRAMSRPTRRTITTTLQIIEPPDAAATNKATNPCAASGTTGWTNNGLTLMERQTTLPALLPGFDTAIHATGNADDDSAYLSAAVTTSVPEVWTAWVYVVSGTVHMEVWTAGVTLNATSATIPTGAWRRVVVPYVPTTTATYTFRIAQFGAGTSEFYVTGMLIGPSDPYFDGDTAGCSWTGTRNASTSTRLASGGSRYQGIINAIEAKIAKLNRSGGTYRRTFPAGNSLTFDVDTARVTKETHDVIAEARRAIKVELEFTCRPYGRGDVVTV